MMFMKVHLFLLLVSFGVFVNGAAIINRRAATTITAAPEATPATRPVIFLADPQNTVISLQGGEAITLADEGVTTVFAGKTWTILAPSPSPTPAGLNADSLDGGAPSASTTSTADSSQPTDSSGESTPDSGSSDSSTTSTDSTGGGDSASTTSSADGESSSAEPTSTADGGDGSSSSEPTATSDGGDGETSTTTSSSASETSSASDDNSGSSTSSGAVITTVLTTDGATQTILSSVGPYITLAPTGTTTSFAGHLYTIAPSAAKITTSKTGSASPTATSSSGDGGNKNAAMPLHSFGFCGLATVVGGVVIGAWLTL